MGRSSGPLLGPGSNKDGSGFGHQEDQGLRACPRARRRQPGSPGSRRRAQDRGEEPLVEHRRPVGRSRPAPGGQPRAARRAHRGRAQGEARRDHRRPRSGQAQAARARARRHRRGGHRRAGRRGRARARAPRPSRRPLDRRHPRAGRGPRAASGGAHPGSGPPRGPGRGPPRPRPWLPRPRPPKRRRPRRRPTRCAAPPARRSRPRRASGSPAPAGPALAVRPRPFDRRSAARWWRPGWLQPQWSSRWRWSRWRARWLQPWRPSRCRRRSPRRRWRSRWVQPGSSRWPEPAAASQEASSSRVRGARAGQSAPSLTPADAPDPRGRDHDPARHHDPGAGPEVQPHQCRPRAHPVRRRRDGHGHPVDSPTR